MEMLRAGIGKGQRLRRRIITINGGAIHIAFGQTHDLAIFQIDGGKDNHGFHSRKRASRSRP